MYDLVIWNGTVVDGTGSAPRSADVAIEGDRIAAVGANLAAGEREIDAEGVSPRGHAGQAYSGDAAGAESGLAHPATTAALKRSPTAPSSRPFFGPGRSPVRRKRNRGRRRAEPGAQSRSGRFAKPSRSARIEFSSRAPDPIERSGAVSGCARCFQVRWEQCWPRNRSPRHRGTAGCP